MDGLCERLSFLGREDDLKIEARAEQLHGAVARVIWAEHERPEVEAPDDARAFAFDLLDEQLAEMVRDPRFAEQPLDEQVAAICRGLGSDPGLAGRWRELPEPDYAAIADSAPDWRGSG